MSLKFGVSHSSISASAESLATNINYLNCRDKKEDRCSYENSKEQRIVTESDVFKLQKEKNVTFGTI